MDTLTITVISVAGGMIVLPTVVAVLALSKRTKVATARTYTPRIAKVPQLVGDDALEYAKNLVARSVADNEKAVKWLEVFEGEVDHKASQAPPPDWRMVGREKVHETFERWEANIQRAESGESSEKHEHILSPEAEANIDAFADRIKRMGWHALALIRRAGELRLEVDRDPRRAYRRLVVQVANAHSALEQAEVARRELRWITNGRPQAPWDGPNADSSELFVQPLTDEERLELEELAATLRRKTFYVEQGLFHVDRLMIRLQIIETLITCFGSANSELQQLREAIVALSKYVSNIGTQTDSSQDATLEERFALLESRCLAFVAHRQTEPKARKGGEEQIRLLAKTLASLQTEEEKVYRDWSRQATENSGLQFATAVAEIRAEQSESVLRSLLRARKVLASVTDTAEANIDTL